MIFSFFSVKVVSCVTLSLSTCLLIVLCLAILANVDKGQMSLCHGEESVVCPSVHDSQSTTPL